MVKHIAVSIVQLHLLRKCHFRCSSASRFGICVADTTFRRGNVSTFHVATVAKPQPRNWPDMLKSCSSPSNIFRFSYNCLRDVVLCSGLGPGMKIISQIFAFFFGGGGGLGMTWSDVCCVAMPPWMAANVVKWRFYVVWNPLCDCQREVLRLLPDVYYLAEFWCFGSWHRETPWLKFTNFLENREGNTPSLFSSCSIILPSFSGCFGSSSSHQARTRNARLFTILFVCTEGVCAVLAECSQFCLRAI